MRDRARDRLGRPVSADDATAVPGLPDLSGLSDAQVWQQALAYADAGLPFHAHEACESRWRTCAAVDRRLWRALAQWGAACTHEARGNTIGARRLAERAHERLATVSSMPAWLEIDRVARDLQRLLAD